MDKEQFKKIAVDYLRSMIDKWFDTKSVNDTICKALANTILNANVDKYDNYLDYICDKNGEVCINDFLDNIIAQQTPYQIDLTKYDMPFLPNKILLISRQDLILLKNMCLRQVNANGTIQQ